MLQLQHQEVLEMLENGIITEALPITHYEGQASGIHRR
jgi:hypothetical protein